MIVPLYQSETAPKWIRGAIVGTYQLAITIGLLLAAIVNNSSKDRMDTGSYRIPIAVQFAWSLILFFGMIILPETPRYFIKKNKMDKAAHSLGKLRRLPEDHPAVLAELDEVRMSHEAEMLASGGSSYFDCFRHGMLKRMLTGLGIQALQQLTGYVSAHFNHSLVSLTRCAVSTLSFTMERHISRTLASPMRLSFP